MAIARTARRRRCGSGMIMLLLAGCGILALSFPAQADPVYAEAWTQLKETELDFLFVKAGADLRGFDEIMIDPLSVWHPGRQKDDDRIASIRQTFETNFARKLESAGFVIAEHSGPGVLRLHVEIIDLKLGGADDVHLDGRFLFDVSPGRITLVAELHDSVSGDVLLRIADLEKATLAGANVAEQTQRAFDNWAAQFGGLMLGMTEATREDPALMAHRIIE